MLGNGNSGRKIIQGSKTAERTLLLFLIIVFIRLLLTLIEPYGIDMNGYVAWSRYLAEHGPEGLYSHFHIVYAPFYQYILWLTGIIAKLFNLSTAFHMYFIKLWSVLFEFIGAWIILHLSQKYGKRNLGMVAAMCYLINPAVWINSSVWGQFDSIPATMLIGAILLFDNKKPNLAALLFLIAVLTKPQSGLLLPAVLYLYFKDFKPDLRFFKRLAIGLTSGIAVYLLIVLPFYQPTALAGLRVPSFLDPFYWLIDLYLRSIMDYPYATANGFNFWMLVGGQIQPDTLPFMGLTYQMWGYILLFLAGCYAFYILYIGKASMHALIYFCFLVDFSAFMFMTKMHERYLLPAVVFILLAAIWSKKHILIAVLTSICIFINHLIIYINSFDDIYWLMRWNKIALVISALTLITYILSLINGYHIFKNNGLQLDQKLRKG